VLPLNRFNARAKSRTGEQNRLAAAIQGVLGQVFKPVLHHGIKPTPADRQVSRQAVV
jgi:hypothetical protein